jgi:hypothetical protein
MNKRVLIGSGVLSAIMVGFGISKSMASSRNSATWKVPPGVKKIRVRSWNADGTPDMDRTLNVEPNQTFRIDSIED